MLMFGQKSGIQFFRSVFYNRKLTEQIARDWLAVMPFLRKGD